MIAFNGMLLNEKLQDRSAAIVLAAGLSTRMGENKLLLKLGEKTVLEWVIINLLKAGFNSKDICVVVSTTTFKSDLIHVLLKKNITVVRNSKAHLGQSTSVKLALRNMMDRRGVFFFLGDQPFIHPVDIKKLRDISERTENNIIVPITENGKRGNPVYFPKENFEELLKIQGDRGGRELLSNPINKIKEVPVYKSFIHFDMDTKENYEEAKRLFERWRDSNS